MHGWTLVFLATTIEHPQLDETDGVIAVEPTVLNSVLEKLDFVGFPVH